LATALPYSGHSNGSSFVIEGRQTEPGSVPLATLDVVTPNYPRTMHIALLAGRQLAQSDGADAMKVALISERLAARWWPGEPYPIGRRIKLGPLGSDSPWTTIVGVLADTPQDFYDRGPRATLYLPFPQSPQRWVDIGLRAAGDPMALAGAATAAVRSIDPHAPVSDIRTLEKAIRDNGIGLTYVAVLMAVLGVIALVLSCVGVYGVMSYVMAQQTNEIGVRMALGATGMNILGMVFRRGMTPAISGLLVGIAGSYGLARLLQALVFGVTATDPATFAGIPLALVAAAALAVYIPARRAVKIEPMTALRCE
jgi:putative ABC transport system permease protein